MEEHDTWLEEASAGFTDGKDQIGRFNLGLFGLTGVGKSTLVNVIFGQTLAQTGFGAPVTQSNVLYRMPDSALGVLDTKGLELGQEFAQMASEMRDFVHTNVSEDADDRLHVIWYCISAGGSRIQLAEADFIRSLAALGIPVIPVITQTALDINGQIPESTVELAHVVEGLDLPIRTEVHFVDSLGDEFTDSPAFGLTELLDATATVAPEGVRNALASAQRIDGSYKQSRAQALIEESANQLSGGLLLTGLAHEWGSMFAGIADVFGFPDATAREVFAESEQILRLRGLLMASNAHLVAAPGITKLVAKGKESLASRKQDSPGGAIKSLGSRWRRRPDQSDVETAAHVSAEADEVAAAGRSAGAGFSAGTVTRAVGDAWAVTCHEYWQASYPEAVDEVSTRDAVSVFESHLAQPKALQLLDGTRETLRGSMTAGRQFVSESKELYTTWSVRRKKRRQDSAEDS